MPVHLGTVRPGSKVRFAFGTSGADGSYAELTNAVVGDIKIYKDGVATNRSSTNGYAIDVSIDSILGINYIEIDLADNSDGDFFKSGSNYIVALTPVVVDSLDVQTILGTFDIGYPDAILNTWIEDSSLSSQTVFDLTTGPAEDDALNGCRVVIHDAASAVQFAVGFVSDYDGTNKRVTLAAAPTFTIANKDNVSIFLRNDISHVNGAVVNGSGTPDVNVVSVSGDTTAADTLELFAEALDQATGQLDSGSLANGTITAASIASDAITAAKVAADVGAEIADAVWDEASAGHLAAGTLGLFLYEAWDAATNIDTNLGTPSGSTFSDDFNAIKTDTAAILVDTGTTLDARIPAALVGGRMDCSVGAMASNVITASALNTDAVSEFWTTALTESYAADGATFTGAQALYMIFSGLYEFSISGTTKTNKKLDGSTTSFVQTLDDATNPTSTTKSA
jgi:hypothetical protein